MIHAITQNNIALAWSLAAPWMQKAFGRGGGQGYPIQDLLADIQEGTKRLYCVCDDVGRIAWLCMGVKQNSEHRTCHVYAIGGHGALAMLPEIVPFVEAFAVYNGCKYVSCSGRKGWERELKKYGWAEIARTYGKEIG